MRKHGTGNIRFEILEVVEEGDLDSREVFWISKFNTFKGSHGLNLNEGGGGNAGWKHSKESIELVIKNRPPVSEKAKTELSQMAKRIIRDPEHIAKMEASRQRRFDKIAEEKAKELALFLKLFESLPVDLVRSYLKDKHALRKRLGLIVTGEARSLDATENRRKAQAGKVASVEARKNMSTGQIRRAGRA